MLCRAATDIAWADESASVKAVRLRGEGPILMLPATEEGLIIPRDGAANAATIGTDKRKEDTKTMSVERWSCSQKAKSQRRKREKRKLHVPRYSSRLKRARRIR